MGNNSLATRPDPSSALKADAATFPVTLEKERRECSASHLRVLGPALLYASSNLPTQTAASLPCAWPGVSTDYRGGS